MPMGVHGATGSNPKPRHGPGAARTRGGREQKRGALSSLSSPLQHTAVNADGTTSFEDRGCGFESHPLHVSSRGGSSTAERARFITFVTAVLKFTRPRNAGRTTGRSA